jgi:hypothetical protein
MAATFSALVRDKWAPLLAEDFTITCDDAQRVVLESSNVRVVAVHDPRGEVDVSVVPRGGEWPAEWSYSGMVGAASVGRLLETALAEMRAEPAVLDGDPDFYERLARENGGKSVAWTAYYSGRGPRPGNRQLP